MNEAVNIVREIITDVLTALYQPFWFAITLSFFASMFYLYAFEPEGSGKGIKESFKVWIEHFKSSRLFRRLFLLIFCGTMILFRTLYYRAVWLNPLQDVLGGWWIWKTSNSTGEVFLTTECFENVLLMMPFTFLYLFTFYDKGHESKGFLWIVKTGAKIAFLFSLIIELAQLFFRQGTFQLSDLFYNTIGGCIGGILYYIFAGISNKNRR